MDKISEVMDNFSKHLAHLPRRFPGGLSVQSVGYTPRKTDRVHRTFSTFNFSLILSGSGTYDFQGNRQEVVGPCMITQWPGELMNYGPADGQTWEEFYLIYQASARPEFELRKLAHKQKPSWPIRHETRVRDHFTTLCSLLRTISADGMADRFDRTCELLIIESYLGEHKPPTDREERAIAEIRKHVNEHYAEHHDFTALARRHGFSASTFRRHWARHVGDTPARYVISLRIREARRLLVETDMSMAEIAARTGFEDPLYFSRCFHRLTGLPPTIYRAHFPD